MKHVFFLLPLSLLAAFFLVPSGAAALTLPLETGWYVYDSERTYRDIEGEYAMSNGGTIEALIQTTQSYSGVVCRFEDGALFDPLADMNLSIDRAGNISCANNVSIKGKLESDGRFLWSGLVVEHEREHTVFVKGTLTPVPADARGGAEYDGVYHMKDSGEGREQLVTVADGFYTWNFIDGEDAGYRRWPIVIKKDGSFSYGIEFTTVMKMGDLMGTNFSSSITCAGRIIPGQSITMEETSRTTGTGEDAGGAPQVYAGSAARSGEYPNEQIPKAAADVMRTGRAEAASLPAPDLSGYPEWYVRIPAKAGFLRAAGEKTFDDRDTALAMAEAAAAAGLAENRRMKIESEMTESGAGGRVMTDERFTSESSLRMEYTVVEKIYNEKTRTAFVLAEMKE